MVPIQRHAGRGEKLQYQVNEVRFDYIPVILEEEGGSPSGLELFVASRESRACQISDLEGGAERER